MKLSASILATAAIAVLAYIPASQAYVFPVRQTKVASAFRTAALTTTATTTSTGTSTSTYTSTTMQMSADDAPDPTSFREAEVLGLRLMQEGSFEQALIAFQKGMKLPGTRPDVIRNKSLSGPSPVGGAFGGTSPQRVLLLDDFELQAAHYNMACAHARLGNLDESVANLAKAFENGFDNYSTVRGDPDLDPIKKEGDFGKLMDTYESSKGFNPFGFLGGKKK